MKKKLIILGILFLCAATVLTAVLLYNRFNRSVTRVFEVSTGDRIRFILKTGTGLGMTTEPDGTILFSLDGENGSVTAQWCTLEDYSKNIEQLKKAGIDISEKTYGKVEVIEFKSEAESTEYGAMTVVSDSHTAILFKSNNGKNIERVLKSCEISKDN